MRLGSILDRAERVDRAGEACWIERGIRSFDDIGYHLVQGGQSLLSLQILPQIVFLPFLEPLLTAIVELSQKVRPYLMI